MSKEKKEVTKKKTLKSKTSKKEKYSLDQIAGGTFDFMSSMPFHFYNIFRGF